MNIRRKPIRKGMKIGIADGMKKNGNKLSEIPNFINLRGENSQGKREFLFSEGLFISISGSLE